MIVKTSRRLVSSSSLADDGGGEELGPGLHGSHRPSAGAGLELFRDHGVAKPEQGEIIF